MVLMVCSSAFCVCNMLAARLFSTPLARVCSVERVVVARSTSAATLLAVDATVATTDAMLEVRLLARLFSTAVARACSPVTPVLTLDATDATETTTEFALMARLFSTRAARLCSDTSEACEDCEQDQLDD